MKTNKDKYNFWEELPGLKEVSKKRACLGLAASCRKTIFGTKAERLCGLCAEFNRERGRIVDLDQRKNKNEV